MRRSVPLLLALMTAACGSQENGLDGRESAPATVEVARAPVVLPPSISATRTFRCADNSLVTIEFLSDGRSANVSMGSGKPSAHVQADAAGQPMSGGGWSVTAVKTDMKVSVTPPGAARPLACHV